MYSNTNFTQEDWDQDALNQQIKASESYATEEQARRKAFEDQTQQESDQKSTSSDLVKKDGSLKSSFDTKDPKQFGLKENFQETGNALTAGLQDIGNSVAGLPQKIVDPRFYSSGNVNYKPAWLPFNPDDQPITRTIWGSLLRGTVELGGLMLLTRKAAGVGSRVTGTGNAVGKGLSYVAKGPTMVKGKGLQNLGKVVVHGAVTGAPSDLISATAAQGNLASSLIKIRPDWEDALKPFATTDDMSPAQRSLYTMFEGMGAGAVLDLAGSGISRAVWATAKRLKTTSTSATTLKPNPNDARYANMRKAAEKQLDFKVTLGAQREVEKAFTVDPTVNKQWKELSADEQYTAKQAYARRSGYDWASDEHPALKRQTSQDNNEIKTGIDRLNADPEGEKGFDPYINEGGDVHQGRANSTATSFRSSLESVHRMSTRWADIDGTPNNFITKNELERINNTPGGVPITQEEYMKRIDKDGVFRQEIERLREKRGSIDELAPQVFKEFDEVIAGRKTVGSMTEDEFQALFTRNYDEYGKYAGVDYYSDIDHLKAAVLTSTLNREIRDYANLQKSIMDAVDPTVRDGTLDQILDRYTAIGIGLKQSRYLRSISLSNLKYLNGEVTGKPPGKSEVGVRLGEIATEQRSIRNIIREAVDSDTTDDLLKLITDAFSANEKLSTWADLDQFFSNKLHGYKEGDFKHQSATNKELGALLINSTISGPKTPVRAAFGTGLITFTRPVATAVGAMLRNDQRALRGAWASLNGMYDSVGESMVLFRHALKSNFSGNEIPDLNTIATRFTRTDSDAEWESISQWVQTRGSDADQAAYGWANTLRWMNRNPLLTWASKVMSATDLAFHNVVGRARLREIAYHKAYDSIADSGRAVDDAMTPELVSKYETAFYDEVFDERGMLTDQMAKHAASEAAMTLDMPKIVERLEQVFAANPFSRPFMLFTRTGYNALELAGKHTPFLNKFVAEVAAIKNLPTGHPDLIKYGISTPDDHAAAKALVAGREAIGASVMFSAIGLYMSGRLTGNGPEDKTLRESRTQQGWQPRSILVDLPGIGPKFISYEPLEPFNSFLAAVADIGDTQQQMGEPFVEKSLGQLWYLLQANIVNKSFLFGLSQLSELMGARDADKIGSVAAGVVNSYIPMSSMRNEIGKYFNPGMRELESGFADSFKNRNLWAGELAELPYKHDILNGQPLKQYDWATRTWNALMPFQINLAPTPTRQMLWRSLYDVKITVNTKPDGGAIPSNLKSKWQKLIGEQNVEGQLEKLFFDKRTSAQILDSITQMETDRDAGKLNDSSTYLHNEEIGKIFAKAKRNAWVKLTQDSAAGALIQKQAEDKVLAELRKKGRYQQEDNAQQILNLKYGK